MELTLTIGKTGKKNVFDISVPHHGWCNCLVKAKSESEAREKFYDVIAKVISNSEVKNGYLILK